MMARIKEKSSLELHHVPTDHNPADLGTRGMEKYSESLPFWLNGPKWLTEDKSQWPLRPIELAPPTEEPAVCIGLEQI